MTIANRHRLLVKQSGRGGAFRTLVVVASAWMAQGTLMMEWTERLFKGVLECAFFLLVSIPLHFWIEDTLVLIVVSIPIAHTLNFLANGQLTVAMKGSGRTTSGARSVEEFIDTIRSLAKRNKSIATVAAFGSYAMQDLTSHSDLDVRVIRRKGFINGVKASIFTMRIRQLGLRRRFPIDIYLLDDYRSLSMHISPQELEKAVVLHDADNLAEDIVTGHKSSW